MTRLIAVGCLIPAFFLMTAPAVAQEPIDTWTLEDTFLVQTIEMDAEGYIYAPDREAHQVHIFDPEGRRVDTIGREGEGPGEFQRPLAIALDPDETTFAVRDTGRRVSLFDRDGAFESSFVLPDIHPSGTLTMRFRDAETLVLGGFQPESYYEADTLHFFSVEGEHIDSFLPQSEEAEELHITMTVGAGFDTDGERIYAVHPMVYRIYVLSMEGEKLQSIDVSPLPEHYQPIEEPQPDPMEDRAGAIEWSTEINKLRQLVVASEDHWAVRIEKPETSDTQWMIDFIDTETGEPVHSWPTDGWLAHADPEHELIYIAEPQDEPVTELRAYRVEDVIAAD